MPQRAYTASSGYRFGFNGKLNDDEVFGNTATSQDYGMRWYNPRIGRFFSVDPLTNKYPWYSPYQFAGNKVIAYVDRDGAEEEAPGTDEERDENGDDWQTQYLKNNIKAYYDEEEEKEENEFERDVQKATNPNNPLNIMATAIGAATVRMQLNQIYPPISTPDYKDPLEQANTPEAFNLRICLKLDNSHISCWK